MVDENISTSENAEGDITENEIDIEQNIDDLEDDLVGNDEGETTVKEEQEDVEKEPEKHIEIDPYAGLTEEEKEAKIRQEQLLAKKQKVRQIMNSLI